MDDIPIRSDGLQIDEDRAAQERMWTAERVAWIAFLLIVLAALAGASGAGGPLAQGTRQIGPVTVEYPAITRWTASDVLKLHLGGDGDNVVTLAPGFLAAFEIETIRPDPVSAASTSQGLRLEFQAEGDAAAPVTLGVQAMRIGRVRYDISVAGRGASSFTTFVMP